MAKVVRKHRFNECKLAAFYALSRTNDYSVPSLARVAKLSVSYLAARMSYWQALGYVSGRWVIDADEKPRKVWKLLHRGRKYLEHHYPGYKEPVKYDPVKHARILAELKNQFQRESY